MGGGGDERFSLTAFFRSHRCSGLLYAWVYIAWQFGGWWSPVFAVHVRRIFARVKESRHIKFTLKTTQPSSLLVAVSRYSTYLLVFRTYMWNSHWSLSFVVEKTHAQLKLPTARAHREGLQYTIYTTYVCYPRGLPCTWYTLSQPIRVRVT